MTEEDKQDLREMQEELLEAENSPWQPRCVAQAFCSVRGPFVFTMQVWIDLDALGSPFLLGRLPEEAEEMVHFKEAFLAFGYVAATPEACEPEDLVILGRKMVDAIVAGFGMRVKLAPPEGFVDRGLRIADCGMGDWLPVLACLKSQLGFSLSEALALPVGQAFALMAAHRVNEGWSVAGEGYATREVGTWKAEGGSGEQGSRVPPPADDYQPSTLNSQPS